MADKPWDRLDELVRGEMAAGRKVADIATDFLRVADDVWGTPGLSEDAGDALGDTLDALTGNCGMESSCYKDPPNNTVPTKEEIVELPRWARAAFAARCARRVQPLQYRDAKMWPQIGGLLNHFDESIRVAEGSASEGRTLPSVATLIPTVSPENPSAQIARNLWVVQAVLWSSRVTDSQTESVYGVAHHAEVLAEASIDFVASVRRDFDHLARLAEWQHWTDDTPVPPDVFGPLWPEGPPPGWPADPDVPQRAELPVSFLALERVIPMVLEDEAVNVFNALNRYYIARTGDRLTLDGDIHTLVTALVGAGV
jgi:hypothetical protein